MGKDIVADFTAFLSVVVDDTPAFETSEGRVVMTRADIVFADGTEQRRLALESLQDFDFRTVPAEWEQFFDDLVGVRFDDDTAETLVTIGTDTALADRFVTVLLKLLLEDATAHLRQQFWPLDGNEPTSTVTTETEFTLLPRSERIQFEDDEARPIDISFVTGVETPEDTNTVVVRHLDGAGRFQTELRPASVGGARFLQTYLEFRTELAETAGPLQFVYVGEDRDSLVLVAKLLTHRRLEFNAGHVNTGEELVTALASTDARMECIVSDEQLSDASGQELIDRLRDEGHDVPIVLVTRDRHDPVTVDDPAVDVVRIGSRTDHYEDVADAIQRAVVRQRHAAVQDGEGS